VDDRIAPGRGERAHDGRPHARPASRDERGAPLEIEQSHCRSITREAASLPFAAPSRYPFSMADHVLSPGSNADDDRFDRLFRPSSLDEYIGQTKHKDNLKVFVEAARCRREPLDHILFCGPPGLGKTTLAYILSKEMGVTLHATSGPAVEH